MNEETRLVWKDVTKHILAGAIGAVVGVKLYSKFGVIINRRKK